MFQLPLLASGAQGLGKAPGTGRIEDGTGLAGLLQGADPAMAGFSGELQAMLMQLSPQMLQRMQELLAGGMSLPLAANAILEEAASGANGELFADLLQQRPTGAQAGRAGDVTAGLAGDDGPLGQFAARLEAAGVTPREMAAAGTALPAGAALHSAAQAAGGSQMPAQLASSLLDMGVPQQVGAKGWENAIADRVMWMVQGDQQSAKLTLNPPNLGPLEVRISVQHDQTSVSFLAPHAVVREALEAALPRLREMFDQQSLQLVRADVSDPGAQQGDRTHDPSGRPGARRDRWHDDPGASDAGGGLPAIVHAADGLIDLFA